MTDRLLTPVEAAAYLSGAAVARRWSVNPETVRRLRLAGRLPYFKPTGRTPRYRLADIEAYERDHFEHVCVAGLPGRGAAQRMEMRSPRSSARRSP